MYVLNKSLLTEVLASSQREKKPDKKNACGSVRRERLTADAAHLGFQLTAGEDKEKNVSYCGISDNQEKKGYGNSGYKIKQVKSKEN